MARRWKKTLADENSDKFMNKDADEQNEFELPKIDDAQLMKALQQYDDEMLESFFDRPEDEPPIALSDRGRENLRDTLSQLIGDNRADLLMVKEQQQYEASMTVWKNRRIRLAKRVVRWSSVAASVVFAVFIGNIFSGDIMAYRLPQSDVSSVKKDEYSQFKLAESQKLLDSISENNSDALSTKYLLMETLNDFYLEETIITSTVDYYVYVNKLDSDVYYQFSQAILDQKFGINTEEKDYITVDSPFGDAYYYEYEDFIGLVWNYNGYLFRLEGNITKEQLLYLQKYVRKEE